MRKTAPSCKRRTGSDRRPTPAAAAGTRRPKLVAVLSACLPPLAWASPGAAQTPVTPSNAELAKESVNPVTRFVTVPLRYQGDFEYGPTEATKSTFEPHDSPHFVTGTLLPAGRL